MLDNVLILISAFKLARRAMFRGLLYSDVLISVDIKVVRESVC